MGTLIDKLQNIKPDTVTQILKEMFNDTDIELKTDLPNSMVVSRARLAAALYQEEKCPKTGKLLKTFLDFYVRDRVSDHRKSREEVIAAVTNLMSRQDPLADKLLGNDRK